MSNYRKDLLEDLKSPRYSAKYLSAAYADSAEAFLVALRDVASAQKGMTKLAAAAEVNRENLYRMLSKEGNPRLDNLRAVFEALNLRVTIEPALDASEPSGAHSSDAELKNTTVNPLQRQSARSGQPIRRTSFSNSSRAGKRS